MIDPKKTYCTRDGREVRIYATDHNSNTTIAGAVRNGLNWESLEWHADGKYVIGEHPADLIEAKPRLKIAGWVNVYRGNDPKCFDAIYPTRDLADIHSARSRVACVRIEIDVEHGHGLEGEE